MAENEKNQYARPWNTTGKTWIDVEAPGPWAVDNSLSGSWGIINTETGRTKQIGPVQSSGANYFDKAKDEAIRRNREGVGVKKRPAPSGPGM